MNRLWRHHDFLKLWGGQAISETGSQITQLALPTAAIVLLHAGAVQVGILGALLYLGFPTLGLIAGVVADRVRRRRLMIACDLLRMVAMASIPLAWALGDLSMAQIYVVAVANGVGTVFFDVTTSPTCPRSSPVRTSSTATASSRPRARRRWWSAPPWPAG